MTDDYKTEKLHRVATELAAALDRVAELEAENKRLRSDYSGRNAELVKLAARVIELEELLDAAGNQEANDG